MSGPLPLAIVRSSLTELHGLAERESLIQKQRLLIEILETRDSEIISQISDPSEVKKMKVFFEKDQSERRIIANQKCILDSSESLAALLHDLEQELQNNLDEGAKDLEKLSFLRMKVLEAEHLLSSVPEHETIVDHLANQKNAVAKLTELQEAFAQAEEKLNTNIRERDRIEVAYDRFLRQQALEGIEELEDHRVAQYAERSIETLQVFIEQSLDLHLSQIESAILSCFLELIGKGSLIDDIRIDKETMQMTLATDDNPDFPVERLSAGERQLLAIATLWGLTLTTGQQLPVVVDTPLGRLDSEHRKALVSRYFGGASHQVLLLSTDEEVDDQLTEILEPFISKKYILEYNDEERRTVISTGYFERQEA
jgi:DNA sulfur modification protein DndD